MERLISGSEFLRNPRFMEAQGSIENSLDNSVSDDVTAFVFDASVFSYDDIMDWMYARASEGKRYTMGLYSFQTGKLITEDDVL